MTRHGAGSVYELEKGKRYRVRVSVGYDRDTGKRRVVSKNVRGTRRDAERELARLLVQYSRGEAPTKSTLSEFFYSYYLPDARNRLRPSTVDCYEKDFRVLLEAPLGCYELAKITPVAVDGLLGALPEARRRKAYAMLRQILNKAVRWDFIDSSPMKRVEPPKSSSYEPEVLSASEASAYLEYFKGTSIEAAVLVAIGAGLRRSEIIALDWDDIRNGAVHVSKGITKTSNGLHTDEPKSRFGIRTVHLPSSVSNRLEELRGEGPLLVGVDGKRMTPDALSHRYGILAAKLPDGLSRISLKNLRHTSLTLALEGGADILAVSRRGGHSGPGITSRYYLRPHESVDKSAADGIDKLL